jgi:hypothetical protein
MTPMGGVGLETRPLLAVPKTYLDGEAGRPIAFRELGKRDLVDARLTCQFEQARVIPLENDSQGALVAVSDIAFISRGEENP